MTSEAKPLRIAFIPLMAPGHMIPMLDMAKLFASRGVAATIITTPLNAPVVRASIEHHSTSSGHLPLHLHLITPPPSFDARENMILISSTPEMVAFLVSLSVLRPSLEDALSEIRPHAVIADMFFTWVSDFARDVLGVPRFVFQGTNLFSLCAALSFHTHKPLESIPEDCESFVLPEFPHRIELLRTQVMDQRQLSPELARLVTDEAQESERRSHGVIVNSFHELEPEYANYYTDHTGVPTWFVGPVSLCNRDDMQRSTRAAHSDSTSHLGILKWLDSKPPGSVLYLSFGSLSNFCPAQLREIAASLESVNRPFIWVVRNNNSSEWLTEGLEQMISEGGGMIVRGWAPQVMILAHAAVGAFVTHCGWNSCLEGISAGVPMVTWPLFAEQFYNEKLLVDVLGVAVAVGSKRFVTNEEEEAVVGRDEIGKAVERMLGSGGEAEEMRRKVKELSVKARRAVDNGGSSYESLDRLIKDLAGAGNAGKF